MTSTPTFSLRPLTPDDREWVAAFIAKRWGSEVVVAHGVAYRPSELPGFAAHMGKRLVGLLTYTIEEGACEIVSIDSLAEGQGVGSALVEAVKEAAQEHGCQRLWLITTNDNLPALRFYQKRGFRLVRVHPGAVERSRRIKPQIPQIGLEGIPIRDELELELLL